MTGLINDLKEDMWVDKGEPHHTPASLGYRKAMIVKSYGDEEDDGSCTYYLSWTGGIIKAKLSGLIRKNSNPLSQVLNCDMKITVPDNEDEKATITGIMLDTCWVERK